MFWGDSMLTKKTFQKILSYLDKKYWNQKTTETNWNYYGLILDYHFENSVLSIDYLDINDYFDVNGNFVFEEDKLLGEQYNSVSEEKCLQLIQNILNILHHSQFNKEFNSHVVTVIKNVLEREYVKVTLHEAGDVILELDDILDYGSYCNVVRVSDGILRKELKPEYKNDEKLQKRMKYEFENMKKLSGCPQILNVFDFNIENYSYLMEQADTNLLTYLSNEIELSFEEKVKVIIDILEGMNYAHKNSIIHRDLHLGNVLKIGNDFVICDFGLSKDTSIIRSLKTSYTEKNNHIFVDPLAISDFRELDMKSDIYSIGKIIYYIFTYNAQKYNHPFKSIVERCISRDKKNRYNSIEDILSEIDFTLKYQEEKEEKAEIINKILNNQYNSRVHEYLIDLVASDNLSKFIVTHQLYSFGKLIEQFESVYQTQMLCSIENGFSNATGYGGWGNYDIFAQIAYYLYINLQDLQHKKIARSILEDCAKIRYFAQNLLEQLPDE